MSLAKLGLRAVSGGLQFVPGHDVTPYEVSEEPWNMCGPGLGQPQAKLSMGFAPCWEGEALMKGSSALVYHESITINCN